MDHQHPALIYRHWIFEIMLVLILDEDVHVDARQEMSTVNGEAFLSETRVYQESAVLNHHIFMYVRLDCSLGGSSHIFSETQLVEGPNRMSPVISDVGSWSPCETAALPPQCGNSDMGFESGRGAPYDWKKKFTQGYFHVIYLSTSRDRTCFDFSVRTLKSKGCRRMSDLWSWLLASSILSILKGTRLESWMSFYPHLGWWFGCAYIIIIYILYDYWSYQLVDDLFFAQQTFSSLKCRSRFSCPFTSSGWRLVLGRAATADCSTIQRDYGARGLRWVAVDDYKGVHAGSTIIKLFNHEAYIYISGKR